MTRLKRWDTPAPTPAASPSGGRLIGYARVSTDDQDCAAQTWQLREAGCTEIVTEHGSGADDQRPALGRILATIGRGDTLVAVALDRVGRDLLHLLQVVQILQRRGATLRCLREAIDAASMTRPVGMLLTHLFGAFAEFERAVIIERTLAGVAAARLAGRVPGHPGLRARDPATSAALGRARTAAAVRRDHQALGPWIRPIQAMRPDAWTAIARRIAEEGGPTWSGERMRRAWRRLAAAGMIQDGPRTVLGQR